MNSLLEQLQEEMDELRNERDALMEYKHKYHELKELSAELLTQQEFLDKWERELKKKDDMVHNIESVIQHTTQMLSMATFNLDNIKKLAGKKS